MKSTAVQSTSARCSMPAKAISESPASKAQGTSLSPATGKMPAVYPSLGDSASFPPLTSTTATPGVTQRPPPTTPPKQQTHSSKATASGSFGVPPKSASIATEGAKSETAKPQASRRDLPHHLQLLQFPTRAQLLQHQPLLVQWLEAAVKTKRQRC